MKRKKYLKTKRNRILNKIHQKIAYEENQKIKNTLKDLEGCQNENGKMYIAVKNIQRLTPKQQLLINDEFGVTSNDKNQCHIIANYFKSIFYKNAEPITNVEPVKMITPFTAREIKTVTRNLKNNKTPGKDDINIELIKHSPEIIYQQIAKIYNITAETANHPAELTHGLLAPLQKPGKSRGPPANLRPIILLSNLRKILAACMMKRIEHTIDKEIPITQAAYRQKRLTTEHIFSTKTVIERTISAKNETVYLILLDMSKAFDSINRKVLIDDLRPIINYDELHIIKLLLNVKLAVKCGNETSDFFDTDTGAPQGDCASATEFTFYLAKSIPSSMLNNTPEINNHTYCQPNIQSSVPDHLTEHNYCKIPSTKILDIDQHYADDISKITSSKSNIDKMKSELPTVLKSRQLIINDSKTEEYIVSKRNHDWRTCKLLGSLLDTERDIERRKIWQLTQRSD